MLWILDIIFVIYLISIIWTAGAMIIDDQYIEAMKGVGKSMLYLSFIMAVIGHFFLGCSVEFLYNRYVSEGYKLIPILYKEFITPIISKIK